MRVAVAGATGVIGRHVVPRLIERGHQVRAIVTKEGEAAALSRLGIDAVVSDLLKLPALVPTLSECDVALHLATVAPKPGKEANLALNDRIRREGTANLIQACRENGVERYVQQSIAFLTGGTNAIVDERADLLPPTAVTASAIDMESMVMSSGLRWTIIRDGALYGPGTGRDEMWRSQARAGELRIPGDGSDYISLIHVVDLARAFVLTTEHDLNGSIVSVVDDQPVTYKELLTYISRLEDSLDPQPGADLALRSFRVSNAKAREVIGWEPTFPTYRSGLI
jgi:2-alkyl-3-oxoalkanoate reductase